MFLTAARILSCSHTSCVWSDTYFSLFHVNARESSYMCVMQSLFYCQTPPREVPQSRSKQVKWWHVISQNTKALHLLTPVYTAGKVLSKEELTSAAGDREASCSSGTHSSPTGDKGFPTLGERTEDTYLGPCFVEKSHQFGWNCERKWLSIWKP